MTTTTPRPIHYLIRCILSIALLASSHAAAAPSGDAASFRSWAPIGEYEHTALKQGTSFRMSLPTREGNLDVSFHPADVLADSYQAEVVDRRGVASALERPSLRTFTGSVEPDSGRRDFVKLTQLPGGRLTGLVRANGVLYDLSSNPVSGDTLLWIREIAAAELGKLLEGCALSLPSESLVTSAPPSLKATELREIELATEADGRFVTQMRGVARANARILSIVNAVNGFYENDLGLTNRVVFQRAWSGRDPYTSKDSEALLGEFRARFARDIAVAYDDAQLFSGRKFAAKALGRSWVASACESERYGVNQARNLDDASLALLVAHQQAHNLGAGHDDRGVMASSRNTDAALFSDASRSEIASYVSGASCLTAPALGQPPVIHPVGPQQIAEGELLALQLTASDADGDAVVIEASPLPQGASIDLDGFFQYAPPSDAVGCGGSLEISITLSATDAGGSQASEIVPILVADRPTHASPVLENPGNQVVDAGQVVWIALAASDEDGDALSYGASSLPDGAYFDASGIFIWQPTNANAGEHVVSFVATDCAGHEATQSVSIQVNAVPAPHLAALSPSSGADETLVEITGTGFGGSSIDVSFGAQSASILSASVTSLVVVAPSRCADETSVDVVVTRDGIASDNGLTFTYLGPKNSEATCPMAASLLSVEGGSR